MGENLKCCGKLARSATFRAGKAEEKEGSVNNGTITLAPDFFCARSGIFTYSSFFFPGS